MSVRPKVKIENEIITLDLVGSPLRDPQIILLPPHLQTFLYTKLYIIYNLPTHFLKEADG